MGLFLFTQLYRLNPAYWICSAHEPRSSALRPQSSALQTQFARSAEDSPASAKHSWIYAEDQPASAKHQRVSAEHQLNTGFVQRLNLNLQRSKPNLHAPPKIHPLPLNMARFALKTNPLPLNINAFPLNTGFVQRLNLDLQRSKPDLYAPLKIHPLPLNIAGFALKTNPLPLNISTPPLNTRCVLDLFSA